MANKAKLTAEYFPHYAAQKKTVAILKAKFGPAGYAFWFQLLEILCQASGHFLDCSAPGDMDFLSAQTGIPGAEIELILRELLFRGNLDRELWESDRIIWCQNLVDNLSSLYAKRISVPEKPIPSRKFDSRHGFEGSYSPQNDNWEKMGRPTEAQPVEEMRFPSRKCDLFPENAISDPEKTGSKVKEREVKNIPPISPKGGFDEFWKSYPKKLSKQDAVKAWNKINPDEPLQKKIIKSVIDHCGIKAWKKDGGEFIPYPASFLNGRMWEDELESTTRLKDDSKPDISECKKNIIRFLAGQYGCEYSECPNRYNGNCIEREAVAEVMQEKGINETDEFEQQRIEESIEEEPSGEYPE